MLSVGLIVEGSYDEAAIPELIRKSVSSEVNVICRPCGNTNQLMKRFAGFLNEFQYVNSGKPVGRALVIRDADQKNPNDLIARMEEKIRGRIYDFPRRLLIAVQEMEAWLLADEEAVSLVTGKRQQRIVNPETLDDPKARLKKILSDAGIAYTAEVARKIAANTRLDVLSVRCASFKKFREALTDS